MDKTFRRRSDDDVAGEPPNPEPAAPGSGVSARHPFGLRSRGRTSPAWRPGGWPPNRVPGGNRRNRGETSAMPTQGKGRRRDEAGLFSLPELLSSSRWLRNK